MLFCLSLGSSPSKLWCDSSILQVVGLHGYPGKSVDMLAPALCGEWCACFAIETWGLVVMTH